MKDKQFEKFCEEIDAAVFSGDSLCNDETLAAFEAYVERWVRAALVQKAINQALLK